MNVNKIKIFILTFLLILVSGCDVNYELTYKNNKFDENIYFYKDEEEFIDKLSTEENINYVADEMYKLEKNNDIFTKKFKYNKNYAGYEYKSNFDDRETNLPTIANKCYDYVNIIKDETTLTIQTSDEFLCYDKFDLLENVNITFNTNYKVIDSNADVINENKLEWKITEDLKEYKPLYVKLETNKIIKEKGNNIPLIFGIIVSAFIIGLITVIYIKRKQNNEF